MNKICSSLFLISLLVAVFIQSALAVPIGVTVSGSNGSANGNYSTLKAAFDALNLVTDQSGKNIVVTITGSTTETASAVLNQPSSVRGLLL
jgi:hypothetical protein